MVKTMTIATIDIGGTGIKFASLTPDGKMLNKTSIPTPENLEDLLAWLDQRLSEKDYSGIAMSVPGAVNQETGVIDGFSAVPTFTDFLGMRRLALIRFLSIWKMMPTALDSVNYWLIQNLKMQPVS